MRENNPRTWRLEPVCSCTLSCSYLMGWTISLHRLFYCKILTGSPFCSFVWPPVLLHAVCLLRVSIIMMIYRCDTYPGPRSNKSRWSQPRSASFTLSLFQTVGSVTGSSDMTRMYLLEVCTRPALLLWLLLQLQWNESVSAQPNTQAARGNDITTSDQSCVCVSHVADQIRAATVHGLAEEQKNPEQTEKPLFTKEKQNWLRMCVRAGSDWWW